MANFRQPSIGQLVALGGLLALLFSRGNEDSRLPIVRRPASPPARVSGRAKLCDLSEAGAFPSFAMKRSNRGDFPGDAEQFPASRAGGRCCADDHYAAWVVFGMPCVERSFQIMWPCNVAEVWLSMDQDREPFVGAFLQLDARWSV